jgi:hypothetical protein
MRHTWLLLAFGLTFAGPGCSRQPEIKPEDKPRMIRQMVLSTVRLARQKPNLVVKHTDEFIDNLQKVKAQHLDDKGPVYDELIEKYRKLADGLRRSPNSPEVDKTLGEMSELAKKLPM